MQAKTMNRASRGNTTEAMMPLQVGLALESQAGMGPYITHPAAPYKPSGLVAVTHQCWAPMNLLYCDHHLSRTAVSAKPGPSTQCQRPGCETQPDISSQGEV
jgi:hypothetical protein